jgi:uncharacterized Zn finger protein
MKKVKELRCDDPKCSTPLKKIRVVKITTRYRDLTITTYQCPDCGTLKEKKNEKLKKNVQIWD